jgi:hypothetical protein
MPEQLITKQQLAAKLAISVRHLEMIRPTLLAHGLQEVRLPSGRGGKPLKRYREASVDAEIQTAVKEGRAPWSKAARKS